MISVVATLLDQMTNKDFAMKLAINTRDILTGKTIITDLGKGQEHYKVLLEILARLDLSEPTTCFEDFFNDTYAIFEKSNKNTSYIVVSNDRKETLLIEFYNKKNEGYQIHFLCPEYISSCLPMKDIQYWEVASDEK